MLRNLFNQRHPFLMQALGGLIAVIIFIPIGIWVIFNVVTAPPPQAAIQYTAPTNSQASPQAATGTNGGNNSAQRPTPASGGSGGATCATKTCTVLMKLGPNAGTYVFDPAVLTVKAGTTVTFKDVGGVIHNIVPNPTYHDSSNPINRPAYNAQDYTVPLSQKGTFHYECQIHLPTMIGQITVS